MAKYECSPCGYVYDPEIGDPDSGIAPGTPFEEIPDDWCCPICGVGKDMFERLRSNKTPLCCRQAKRIKYAAVKLYYELSPTELPAGAYPPRFVVGRQKELNMRQ